MKSLKPNSTALARILTFPLAVGLLAGCDYASRLPDAPTTLGYELQTQKPPSVTAPQGGGLVGPPPPPALNVPPLPAPTQTAQVEVPQFNPDLNTQALRVPEVDFEPPRQSLALPPAPQLPAPRVTASVEPVEVIAPETGLARIGTVGTPPAKDIDGYTPPPTEFPMAEYQVPQIGVAVDSDAQFPEYAPIPFDAEPAAPKSYDVAALQPQPSYETVPYESQNFDSPTYEGQNFSPTTYEPPAYDAAAYEPPSFEPQSFEPQPLDSQSFQPQTSTVLYSPTPLAEPLPFEAAATDMGGAFTVSDQPAPQQYNSPAPSPIMVMHTRLDNGAVLNVHPVVGAPGAASMMLARTIASELGAPVDGNAMARAPAVFDLRASASRDGGRAEAEWKLFSSTGALVGVFPESQSNGTWSTMGDDALRSIGRRVADRLRRNADLRRATLTSLAAAPSITSMNYATALPSGAPSLAPMPRPRPLRRSAPQAAPQVMPQQFVVNTAPMIAADPLANAVPRRRPDGIRTAALAPLAPIAPAPRPVQPVAIAPPPVQPISPPQPLAPLGAPLPAAPRVETSPVPAPSFETLRAATNQAPDGPRSLVFRGVRGAPGNGDQALGREVSRLLAQSGAQLAPNGTPDALYLTADVSRTRGSSSDTIKITWHVEDASGKRVGQVVQENDVPVGALDSNWGEDAFYAAQGARDGIMELLRTSGALES